MAEDKNRDIDDVLGADAVEEVAATEADKYESLTEDLAAEEPETAVVPVEDKKPAKKSKEDKKPGIFVRMGRSIKKFWKSMKSELKRVTWISRKQTFTSTLLVLVCMAISMVVIGLLDVGLSVGLEAIANLF